MCALLNYLSLSEKGQPERRQVVKNGERERERETEEGGRESARIYVCVYVRVFL